jgi:hypothetical protein
LGFVYVNTLNQSLVEGSIFVCLLIWLQFKNYRSKWER